MKVESLSHLALEFIEFITSADKITLNEVVLVWSIGCKLKDSGIER